MREFDAQLQIRSQYKGELAQAYNPLMDPHHARVTLNRWIARSPGLEDRLAKTGYTKRQKILTPAQIALIYEALGEP